jgi:S1-C subfamily serine protease
MSKECAVPECAQTAEEAPALILSEMRLPELPMCGGFVGIKVVDGVSTYPAGVPVLQVGPMTTAHALGLRVGDIIVGVADTQVHTREEFTEQVRSTTVGEDVRVMFVRDGRAVQRHATMKRVNAHGEQVGYPQLGVALDEPVPDVTYSNTVVVTEVEEGSPAHRADIRVGDHIGELGGEGLLSKQKVRDLLRFVRDAESVRLTTFRGSEDHEIELRLAPRQGRTGI